MTLVGRRIFVARARPGPSQLAAELRRRGAAVFEAPALTAVPLDDLARLDEALGRRPIQTSSRERRDRSESSARQASSGALLAVTRAAQRGGRPAQRRDRRLQQTDELVGALGQAREFSALIFACAEGVKVVSDRLVQCAMLPPLVAIGEESASALHERGWPPAVVARGACSDAIRQAGLQGRLLLITEENGRPHLVAELRALGCEVTTVPVYRLQAQFPTDPPHGMELVVVPSSSAATRLYGSVFGALLVGLPTVAFGPQSEAAARAAGAKCVVRSHHDDRRAVIERIEEVLA